MGLEASDASRGQGAMRYPARLPSLRVYFTDVIRASYVFRRTASLFSFCVIISQLKCSHQSCGHQFGFYYQIFRLNPSKVLVAWTLRSIANIDANIWGSVSSFSVDLLCIFFFFCHRHEENKQSQDLINSPLEIWDRVGTPHAPERLQRQDSASLPGNYFTPSKPLGTHHSRPTHGLAATHLPERLTWPPAWEHIDLLVLKHLPRAFYCILPICVQLRDVHTGRHSLLYIWQSEFNIFLQ